MSSTSTTPARPFTRPTYLPLASHTSPSSTASSAFQSCSSLSSLVSPSPASAPLPSPSAQQAQSQYFGSIRPQQPQTQTQQCRQQSEIAAPRQLGYDYRPNRDGAGRTAAETKSLLNEYALLAEAAKRAQMAVLMRDIDGMEL